MRGIGRIEEGRELGLVTELGDEDGGEDGREELQVHVAPSSSPVAPAPPGGWSARPPEGPTVEPRSDRLSSTDRTH